MENINENIQRACRLGDLSLLKESLSKYPDGLNQKDYSIKWTGLYRSVICGHQDTTEYLLISGADPNIRTSMGDTALHQAAENNQYKIAKLLLQYKADPNIQQNDGGTPLHLACLKGNFEMVEILLEYKADPNMQDFNFTKTPLHYAVDYQYPNIITLLVQNDANTELKDVYGKSPKDIAQNSDILELLQGNISNDPSPEPSDIVEKGSFCMVSSVFSHCNSEVSMYSESKSVDLQIKQLEDIHKKIREKVRSSVDTKSYTQSRNNSVVYEPDAEKTAHDNVDKNGIVSFGGTERNPELYNWLISHRLEEMFSILLIAGYDDLNHLGHQMISPIPITEALLQEIGVCKQGLRKRFLCALNNFVGKENFDEKKKSIGLSCCSNGIPNGLWILNVPELHSWLEQLNLKDLHNHFIDAGYDSLEEIIKIMNSPWEITQEDLKNIGIDKPGYRHRILSKLKEDSKNVPLNLLVKKPINIETNTKTTACDFCTIN